MTEAIDPRSDTPPSDTPSSDTPLADCRARLAFDLLANTWNPVVLWALRHGPSRPGELRVRIGGISPKVLTETLRRLESNGLVARRAYGGAPPRVDYELTALAGTLLAPIEAFGTWAHVHGDEVMAAQEDACRRRLPQGADETAATRPTIPTPGTPPPIAPPPITPPPAATPPTATPPTAEPPSPHPPASPA